MSRFPDHPIIGSPDHDLGSFDTLTKPFKIDEYFPSQAPVFVWRLIQCRSGGIGRRAWFRSMYSQGCGGSSPFFGTRIIFPDMPCSAGLLRWLLLMPSDLKAYIKKFKTWLNSSAQDAVKWKTERKERLTWYDERLSRDKLSKLSRDDFSALIKRLWAVNIWHNKDYKVQKLLDENGLDAIRSALLDLLYGKPPIEI